MRSFRFFATLALMALAACANEMTITSTRLATDGVPVEGMPYALPRGLVSVTIGDNEGLKVNDVV